MPGHNGWAHTRGGHISKKRFTIPDGEPVGGVDGHPSIQCYEGRHSECTGHDTLFGGECICRCHQKI